MHMPRSKQDGRLSCRKERSRGTGDTEADGGKGDEFRLLEAARFQLALENTRRLLLARAEPAA